METKKYILRKADSYGNPDITINAIGWFKSRYVYYKDDPIIVIAVKKDDFSVRDKIKKYFLIFEEHENFNLIKMKFIPKSDLKEYIQWCQAVDNAVSTEIKFIEKKLLKM